MSHDEIAKTILEIENAINARWNNGDCNGFLEAYREDVTYFDPLTERCLIGRQAVKEHFGKYFTGARVVRSDQFDPKVVVNDAGDIAILTYNLETSWQARKVACSRSRCGTALKSIVWPMASGTLHTTTGHLRDIQE